MFLDISNCIQNFLFANFKFAALKCFKKHTNHGSLISGAATNVSMSMYIEGISSFSAQTMDYNLDFYFYQEWDDPRLR
jgi:hypothetical protein